MSRCSFCLRRRLRRWLERRLGRRLRYGLRHNLLDRLRYGLSLRLCSGRCCTLDAILRGRGRLGNWPCYGLSWRLR